MKSPILLGAILASSFAMAQEQQAIDTVQLNGRNKLKHERAEFQRHSQSTQVLGTYELNRNNSAFVEQSLNTMAGIQVDKRTNIGGQRFVIRGYGNDQKFNNWGVKFYLNSVPITNADNTTTLEGIDFSLINSVEVVKGPAGTMYGSGLGGVARFYMRPEKQKGVTLLERVAGGSFGLLQSATRVDAVGDGYSVMFNYGHIQSNGYRPNGGSLRNDYAFLSTVELNPKQNLMVYASQNYSNEGVSGQISYADYYAGNDPGNIAYLRKNAGSKIITSRVSISHNWKILPNFSNTTALFYSNLDQSSISAAGSGLTTSPNYGFRSTFHLKNKINSDFCNDLEFGSEYMISNSLATNFRFTGSITNPLETTGIGGSSYARNFNQALSVFAVDKVTYNPWDVTFVAGLSANNAKYNRKDLLALPNLIPGHQDNSFGKNYNTVYTPHIALQKVYKDQIFILSYSEGYNAPTSSSSYISAISKSNDNLKAERAKMWDFSVQGLLGNTKFDYQISVFRIIVKDKLTQLSASYLNSNNQPTNYTYFANTGYQKNQGLEASFGYVYTKNDSFIKLIRPFANLSYYDYRYTNFTTIVGGKLQDYSHNSVVGVPRTKLAVGLDFDTKFGFYLLNTVSYLDKVYTDFNNFNIQNPNPSIKGFSQYNAKFGYKHSFSKFDLDVYVAGNNLTNQINYTYLFLGNSIGDYDTGTQYAKGTATDINPGPSKAYFFGGLNLKYHF